MKILQVKSGVLVIYFLIALFMLISLASCTDNQRAKGWGGTKDVTLKPNHVLLNVTWKSDEVWILSKDTLTGISYFKEQSKWGIVEGQVVINPAK